MKIVASNSLTLSNVNDGTITHTAYAYSSDGTDRFTTVYPNLNLGDNTKTFVGAEEGGSNLRGSIIITPETQKTQDGDFYYLTAKAPIDNYDWFRFFLIPYPITPNMTRVTVKPNTNYTFSVLLKGTGQHTIYAYQNWTAPNTSWSLQINLTSDWKLYTFTVTSNAVIPNHSVQFFIRSNNGTEINLKYPKVEEGSTATPWMPSSSEVTTADWPKYIGHYTDFTQADSTNPSDYTWSLMRGDDGKDGADGKDGIAGKDGKGVKATAITYQASANGTTAPTGTWSASVPTVAKGSFLWTRTIWTYTDNTTETGYAVAYMGTNGNDGTNGLAGKDGVGIKTTTITYVGSTSGTTAPTSGWTSTVPTVAAGSYLWTKTVWTYTDNTSETGYSVARMGLKGDKGDPGIKGSDGTSGIIVSSVAPDSPQTGQLWQDTSTTPQLVKKWTGSEWVIWELYAQNLKADTLETISAVIGKISNTFDNSSGGIDNKGEITIEDSIKVVYYNDNTRTTIDLVTSTSGQGLFAQYLPDKNDATKFQQAWYTPSYLYFSDSINNWTGQITAENVTLVPWTNLTYLSGYTTAENNPCQYRKIKNLDGSYTVQFRGQVKPVSGSFPGTNSESNFQIIANLPVDIRPSRHTFLSAIGDMMGTQTIRIGALSDGRIQVGVRGTASSYIGINSLVYTI